MHTNAQTIYYVLGIIGLIGMPLLRYVFRAHKFFVQLDLKVDTVSANVHTILTNHLPHIYEKLGEKGVETREDSAGDTGRD